MRRLRRGIEIVADQRECGSGSVGMVVVAGIKVVCSTDVHVVDFSLSLCSLVPLCQDLAASSWKYLMHITTMRLAHIL
jgi:hypothetical protein